MKFLVSCRFQRSGEVPGVLIHLRSPVVLTNPGSAAAFARFMLSSATSAGSRFCSVPGVHLVSELPGRATKIAPCHDFNLKILELLCGGALRPSGGRGRWST